MERIAHRGAKREFPENTLSAFRRAFERGADAVELDVHATQDGVVVVHHDPTLGPDGPAIVDLDWADLAATGAGSTVPPLRDVLALTPPAAALYVEIKGKGIERQVCEALTGTSVNCAIHSFDHAAVERLRALAPELPRGVLFDGSLAALDDVLTRCAARDVWPHWSLIDQALVDHVHGRGCRIIAWTVNSATDAARLAALGVDGICTDDVRLLENL